MTAQGAMTDPDAARPRRDGPRRPGRSRPPLRHDRRGVASIEFAIVGAAFVLLLFGVLSIGLLGWTANGLQTVAALTARCAALGSCPDPAAFAVSEAGVWGLPGVVTTAGVAARTTAACNGGAGVAFEQVTITSAYWNGLPPPFNLILSASACFPVPG